MQTRRWIQTLLGTAALAALLVVGVSSSTGPAPAKDAGHPSRVPLGHENGQLPGLDFTLSEVARSADGQGAEVRAVVLPREAVGLAEHAVHLAGGRVEASADGLLQVLVPAGKLRTLAASPAVVGLRTPATPIPQSVDEGVAATGAGAWQAAGYGGAGVQVAVVDVGFAGYQALLGTALPSTVATDDHCAGKLAAPAGSGGNAHGTAAAELVHAMAPQAQLELICIDSDVTLALAEQDAVAAGIRVVSSSVDFLDTSRGDGTGGPGSPDGTVADARAHGILWVNAAGDYGTAHWSGSSSPGSSPSPDYLSFVNPQSTPDGAPRTLNLLTIRANETICSYLKWDDWPLTTEDFDLYLFRVSDGSDVADSRGDQSATSDPADGPAAPLEQLCYTNNGATQQFGLAISRFSAYGTTRLDLWAQSLSGSPVSLEYTTPGGVAEPASSPYALAIGADCWQTGALEPFSATGSTIDGRGKPDLVAPDSVSTATYGPATAGAAGCGTSGFVGTSASAPEAAGAAAVLLGRSPALTPAGLETELEQTSIWADGTATAESPSIGYGALALGPVAAETGTIVAASVGFRSTFWEVGDDGLGYAELRPETSLPMIFGSPSISPDGKTIAFTGTVGSSGIWTMDRTGHDPTEIADAGDDPVWSPDSGKIVFGGQALTVANADGTSPHVLSVGHAKDDAPAWSPDGTRIAWVGAVIVPGSPSYSQDVWIVNADGSGKTQLTHYGDVYANENHGLSWSPDGTRLAFVRGDPAQLTTIDVAGTNPVTILTGTPTFGFQSPVWSPDGNRILLTSNGFWTIKPDGSGLTHLLTPPDDGTFGPPLLQAPSWGPLLRPRATAEITIAGTDSVGSIVTATAGKWVPVQGATFSFSWSRCEPGQPGCSPIPGATDDSYALTANDLGSSLWVSVTATDASGSTATSTGIDIRDARPYALSLPAIAGKPVAGQLLNVASPPTWSKLEFASETAWLRCDAAGSACLPIENASFATYTPNALDVGHRLRLAFFQTPSNVVTSAPTALVTAAGGGGSTGGGGGSAGGGGGGGGPDLKVTATATPAPHNVGDVYAYSITVTNLGAGSSGSTLTVNLPAQVAYNGSVVDRGPGCTNTGQTVTCPLDFFPAGLSTTVLVGARVQSLGTLAMTTSTQSSPAESNPQDGIATVTFDLGSLAPAIGPSTTPISSPKPRPQKVIDVARLTIAKPVPIKLNTRHPSLELEVTASTGTTLTLKLYDSKNRKLCGWTKHARKGANVFTLLLPAKARHAGRDTLRITESHDPESRRLAVTLERA